MKVKASVLLGSLVTSSLSWGSCPANLILCTNYDFGQPVNITVSSGTALTVMGGNVGIGTASPVSLLDVQKNSTGVSGFGARLGYTSTPSADVNVYERAMHTTAMYMGAANNAGSLTGLSNESYHAGSGTLNTLSGNAVYIANLSTGTVQSAIGVNALVDNSSTGKIENMSGGYFSVSNTGGGTVENAIGVAIGNVAGDPLHKWSLYVTDPAAPSYFSGKVGIGVSIPQAPLHVQTSANTGVLVRNTDETATAITGRNEAAGVSGYLGHADYGVYSEGQAGGTTAWANNSDERLKTEIKPIEGALEKILALRGVTYHWRDHGRDRREGMKIGLVAQDVERVFPQAIVVDHSQNIFPDGTKMVTYTDLIAPLIEAVRELSVQHEELRHQVNELKTENLKLKAQVRPSR